MKKILILFGIILLLSGCYDYVEINDLVIISGMLIDYKDDKYEITSQVIENEDKTRIKTYTTTCYSTDECIYEISNLSNKDIFISHMKVLILTESAIKNSDNFIDYFLRDTKSKMNFYVYYVEDKYKKDILNIYEDEGSSFYLKDLIEFNNKIFSSSTPISFLDLVYKKTEFGIEPIYPNIQIINNNDKKNIYLNGLVVFNKNKKILLDDNNSISLNIITNKLNKTIITIPCENDYFSLIVNNSKAKYNWEDNNFIFDISLSTKINSCNCKYDLNNPKDIDKLSRIANEHIKKDISNLINISKENNIDFIGITSYIYKHSRNKYEIKDINTIININTKINSIGEIRK